MLLHKLCSEIGTEFIDFGYIADNGSLPLFLVSCSNVLHRDDTHTRTAVSYIEIQAAAQSEFNCSANR